MAAARKSRKKKERLSRPPSAHVFAGEERGSAIVLPSVSFLSDGMRDRTWNTVGGAFIRLNEASWRELDLTPQLSANRQGIDLRILPAGRVGAVPLASPITGKVVAGLVIKPRFGWSGIGNVLRSVGWQQGPIFPELSTVPGSGREVPPWVIVGPAFERIREMLAHLPRGFHRVREVTTTPRGRIDWTSYTAQLARGTWHHLPCEFSQLGPDIKLLSHAHWALARLADSLGDARSNTDPIALELRAQLGEWLRELRSIPPTRPSAQLLSTRGALTSKVLLRGLEAIEWIADERGLGGGHERDGLAWSLNVDELWEAYVGATLRVEAQRTGWKLSAAQERATTIALDWHRGGSLRSLVPDFVLRKGDEVRVVDAKYKAHFVELNAKRWHEFSSSVDPRGQRSERSSLYDDHRADVHQILAYAALQDAAHVSAELVYPYPARMSGGGAAILPQPMSARIACGPSREVTLTLRAMAFG